MKRDWAGHIRELLECIWDIEQEMLVEKVKAAEMKERRSLGLEGVAADKHYNDWMDRHGMGHLKVPYLS